MILAEMRDSIRIRKQHINAEIKVASNHQPSDWRVDHYTTSPFLPPFSFVEHNFKLFFLVYRGSFLLL